MPVRLGSTTRATTVGAWGRGSPCADAGANPRMAQDALDEDASRHLAEVLPFDLDGGPRQVDKPSAPNTGSGASPPVDMGAFERR